MANRKDENAPPKRNRRWSVFLFSIVVLLSMAWWSGFGGFAARVYAERLASQQKLLYAEGWYDRAALWGDDSVELWFSRARLARKLSLDSEFAEYLNKATERDLPPARRQLEIMLFQAQKGELSPLRSSLAHLLVKGDDADEICFAYAQGAIIKYQLDDAAQILELWEADFPEDPRPNLMRGRLFEHGINLEQATNEFQSALKKKPDYAAAAYNLGRILETQQKPGDAQAYYRMTAESLKNPVPGLVAEARCLRLTQQYEQAKVVLRRAVDASNASDVVAYRLLGDPAEGAEANLTTERGYLAATMEDHQQAVEFLKQALELNPNDWRARYQLAVSQRQIGEQDAARANFAMVEETKAALTTCDRLFDQLSKAPDNIEARLQIGEIFLDHLSENQGVVWLNSVLDLDPDNETAHRLLAGYFRGRVKENPQFARLARSHESFLAENQ